MLFTLKHIHSYKVEGSDHMTLSSAVFLLGSCFLVMGSNMCGWCFCRQLDTNVKDRASLNLDVLVSSQGGSPSHQHPHNL